MRVNVKRIISKVFFLSYRADAAACYPIQIDCLLNYSVEETSESKANFCCSVSLSLAPKNWLYSLFILQSTSSPAFLLPALLFCFVFSLFFSIFSICSSSCSIHHALHGVFPQSSGYAAKHFDFKIN